MKIKTWLKYTEGYLPSPRHRKMRYNECESYDYVNIEEIEKGKTKVAFSVGGDDYILYKDQLYTKVGGVNAFYCGNNEKNPDNETMLGRLIFSFSAFSWFFGFDAESTKEAMLGKAQLKADRYIIIDSDVWEINGEPMYVIHVFGLGGNHAGIGTSLSVTTFYNGNISNSAYFNANEREKAIKEALDTAAGRKDTDSFDLIKQCPEIVVKMPEMVKRNPKRDHPE